MCGCGSLLFCQNRSLKASRRRDFGLKLRANCCDEPVNFIRSYLQNIQGHQGDNLIGYIVNIVYCIPLFDPTGGFDSDQHLMEDATLTAVEPTFPADVKMLESSEERREGKEC